MGQTEQQEGNANIPSSSDQISIAGTTETAPQNIDGPEPKRVSRGQIQFGPVASRLRSASRALRYPTRNVLTGISPREE